MTDYKSILQSKTVWSAAIGAVAFGMHTFNLGDIDQNATLNAVLQIVSGVAYVGAIVFRIAATHKVG